jgi:hypothetical protein
MPLISLGGDCSTITPRCLPGAYCSRDGKCVVNLPGGAACTPGDVCQAPGRCVPTTAVAGTCVMPPDEDGACQLTSGVDCLRVYDYCDPIALRCTRRKAPGTPCSTTDAFECVDDSSCRDGFCAAALPLGRACDLAGADRCAGELLCTAGACALPPPPVVCTF